MRFFKSTFYYTLRFFIKAGLYFYFKKIKVSGLENIPKEGPIIFGANHESAFMDALLITTHAPQFCHYLVRADVFKRPFVKAILSLLNMMPVYRIRDGYSSLKGNNDIFANCYKLLGQGDSLIMFPEGNHDIRRIERRITKGICKVALGAMNDDNGPSALQVVPVGLNYTRHRAFRSSIHIVFGKSIEVPNHEPTAQHQESLRTKINTGLNDCHIRLPLDHYDYHYSTSIKIKKDIGMEQPTSTNQNLQVTEERLSDQIDELNGHGAKFHKTLERFNLDYQDISAKPIPRTIQLLLATPIALYGLLVHLLPLTVIRLIVKFMIKDHVFDASIKFSVGYFLLTMNYLVLGFATYPFFSDQVVNWFLIMISWPISLLLYDYWLVLFRAALGRFRLARNKQKSKEFFEAEKELLLSMQKAKTPISKHN